MSDALSWPRHPVSLGEWEALAEEPGLRWELAEGVLMMSPRPLPWHQHAVTGLAHRITQQLPAELIALAEVEVVLLDGPLTIRVPDVVVTSTPVYEGNPSRLRADDVALVVEVLSDGTRRVDRVLKFAEYAEAGIARYWIVDPGEPTVLGAYVLVDGAYEAVGAHSGVVDLEVAGHGMRIDLDALTRR